MTFIRKLLALMLCICMVLSCALITSAEAGSDIISGSYDGNVTWTYDKEAKVLRFSGTGVVRMDEGWWGNNCYEAATVVIEPGITEIAYQGLSGVDMIEVSIPGTVTKIDKSAFAHCQNLKSITIPGNVKTVGDWAFHGCFSLESVVFEKGIQEIGDSIFFECGNLKEVTLPDDLTYIPNGFLSESQISSITIPDNVVEIRAYAFFGMKNLTSITIPASVQKIGGFAFTNTSSLTNVIFLGDVPVMDAPFYCASFNGVAFYPKGNASWENNVGEALGNSGGLVAAIPYTRDSKGNIIPEAPSVAKVNSAISQFFAQTYPAGSTYPDQYSYILNGNMLQVTGKEAFAFELSDACFGYLPISDKRAVSYDALSVGDILYSGSDVWVITGKNNAGVELAGVQNEEVCRGVTMTKDQVLKASAYRTRVGVSPNPGVVDPSLNLQPVTGPGKVLTEAEVYQTLVGQKEQFPQDMPYSSKNHYHNNVTWFVEEHVTVSQDGHGCSAFSGYLSDLAFGNMEARYFDIGEVNYNNIMVGDRLFALNHEMIVLEVYTDRVIIAEGNYDGRVNWGRSITRQEIESEYALVTRYPVGTKPAARTAFACSHKYYDTGRVTIADCTTSGGIQYTCNSCGYSYATNVTPATGVHRYQDGVCQDCYAAEPPILEQLEDLTDANASAEVIRDAVQSMDRDQLKEVLKADSSAAAELKALEQKAGGAAAVVVENASVGIAAQDVTIVGANLNDVAAGKSAALEIDIASKSNTIPAGYEAETATHFSMTLENVEYEDQLDVPVKITLPVPQNLDAARVAVVHYHSGKAEVLTPGVEKVGGKYYASIVLDHFSDFAFVQKIHEHTWSNPTCTTAKTCATCGATSGSALGHNWAAATCTTPKTCKTCGTTTGGVVHAYTHQYDYKCDACGTTRTVDMTRPMVDMFRMYDPNSGEHFYTGSMEERENLVAVGWQYEGVGFTFPLTTGKPVHRLYDPVTGEHLYTMDEDEMNMLLASGWNYEGIAFNSGFENEVPQYRLHNPNATRGAYHFTASIEERDMLISLGWEYQGIGWYSLGA